jgi:predicted membrane-bound mannosyltransferase
MTLPFNIVIIIAGFYLAFRTSLRGSIMTGIIVGVAMATLAALDQTGEARPIVLIFASRIIGGAIVYPLANQFQAPLALCVIVPLGLLLLLAGGPIDAVQLFTK